MLCKECNGFPHTILPNKIIESDVPIIDVSKQAMISIGGYKQPLVKQPIYQSHREDI